MHRLVPNRLCHLAAVLVALLWLGPVQAQTSAEPERPVVLKPVPISPKLSPAELQIPPRLPDPRSGSSSIPPRTTPTESLRSTPDNGSTQPDPVNDNYPDSSRQRTVAPTPTDPSPPAAVPLQRDGSLMNSGLPSAPAISGKQHQRLKPLRQVLLTAVDMAQAEAQRRKLAGVGVRIVSRKQLSGLGIVLSVFQVPEGLTPQQFGDQLRAEFPDAAVENNQRYRLMGSTSPVDVKHYGQHMVGLTVPSSCVAELRLAMLDSSINPMIAALQGREIRLTDVTGSKSPPRDHGTAIATLLISADPTFPGLLPNASLDAINIFATDSNGDPETRTDWVLQGLNHLAALEPAPLAVNMSFGGDHSAFIKSAIDLLATRMQFVAAAGNAGTSDKVFPAAYDSVIAVGAVDANRRRSRVSNYGEHVQVYAPGEDIWVSDSDHRGFFASGSSYATPFATAALAVLRLNGNDLDDYLSNLGESRLINFSDLCDER